MTAIAERPGPRILALAASILLIMAACGGGGEKVTVTYKEKDGRLIAVDVRDAVAPGRYGR